MGSTRTWGKCCIVDIGSDSDGNEYCIAIRIESHNHPTYINPFEGAATGVGGILRDIFTGA